MGCYQLDESYEVVACEFYMPYRDDKFGVLFAGDKHTLQYELAGDKHTLQYELAGYKHTLQYELEWYYNPSWGSFFGGW